MKEYKVTMVTNGGININNNQWIDALLQLPFFKDFTRQEVNQILQERECRIKKYEKDQMIHMENEKCSTMDIILAGKLTIQNIDANGNVLTIGTFFVGDMIGANLMFSSRNAYPMTAISSCETTLLQIERDLVLELCRKKESFMQALLGVISDKTIVLTDKINAISLKTIRQYLTEIIKYEEKRQGSKVILLGVSKKELAERLGIQRSSLSRELNKMRKDGLVDFDARTITIKNL